MAIFNINIEGQRGEAVERYARLADMSPEDLITRWIKDKVDHVTVTAMRAAGKPWESVAEVLGYSTTQARRIYAHGLDMPLISKDTVKILERYVDLIERAEEIRLQPFTEDDISTVERLTGALIEAAYARTEVRIPTEEDIGTASRLAAALSEVADVGREVWVPTEEDIDTASRLAEALNEAAEAREG
jgi:hypothetical protein